MPDQVWHDAIESSNRYNFSRSQKAQMLIEINKLTKTYQQADVITHALKDISFSIDQGEHVAIIGTSGSGKSTLLHILGCLDIQTSGTYTLTGKQVALLSLEERAHMRNKTLGFIFQRFHLISYLTAEENVALPLEYAGVSKEAALKKARQVLEHVELKQRMNFYPYQLSGGQQQRVAIARALVNKPQVMLADEPTGALDEQTGSTIMKLLSDLHTEEKSTLIVVTHDPEIAQQADRIIEVKDGRIISDK